MKSQKHSNCWNITQSWILSASCTEKKLCGIKMIKIQESEMSFGEFQEENLFSY